MICLHPTDTIPGISLHPLSDNFKNKIAEIKVGRQDSKSFVSLCGSFDITKRFWQKLPKPWDKILNSVWPSPLTVIWQANELAPRNLLAEDNTIAIRVPLIKEEWFKSFLLEYNNIFPSTSVNISGKAPLKKWGECVEFLANKSDVFIPNIDQPELGTNSSSTIIKINADGSFSTIREGSFDISIITNLLQSLK